VKFAARRITLTALELLDRLAALIPPPRRHRHYYADVFAPHAALRARAPPELEAGFAFEFDQSQTWDRTVPPPDPGFSFDRTAN
jgi:hypothetical protein